MPTAVFHGFGDACSRSGMKGITGVIEKYTKSTAKCIEVDTIFGGEIFGNFQKIAEEGCKKIAADPTFNKEFNVFGLS